jgi:hypothetical protein
MLLLESRLTKLRTSLVAIRPTKGLNVHFELQADIKTLSRDITRLKLGYTINIETFPLIYRAEMAGTAIVNAEILAKDENLEDLGSGVPSDVALQIYRQNYEPLYLALASQGLEAPSPWLVKGVHLARYPGIHQAPTVQVSSVSPLAK